MMPDGAIFIAFCFLLRSFHAIAGTGMETAYYIIIAVEYPDNIATVMVNNFCGKLLNPLPSKDKYLKVSVKYELELKIIFTEHLRLKTCAFFWQNPKLDYCLKLHEFFW